MTYSCLVTSLHKHVKSVLTIYLFLPKSVIKANVKLLTELTAVYKHWKWNIFKLSIHLLYS